jgi:hypothetical protein
VALSFSQLAGHHKDRFSSTHWVHLEGIGGVHLITLTGVVDVELEAEHGLFVKEKAGWVLEDLNLEIALPRAVVAADQAFRVSRSAPLVTLNGIGGISTVGWSVHGFEGPSDTLLTDAVVLSATIAVYSSGEVLHRIGYSVSLTGTLEARG